MKRKFARAKRIIFIAFVMLTLLSIAITTPADQIAPARPTRGGASSGADQGATPEAEPLAQVEGEQAEDVAENVAPAPPAKEPIAEEEEIDSEDLTPEEVADPEVEPDEELDFLDEVLGGEALPEDALEAVNGMTHILLIGLDARPGEKTGRSDTMIILTLDADDGSIKMTSLMRDLYVEIPGHKKNRLNSAYVKGGPELLMDTIETNFGVKIDHYVGVNFSVLADVIDQLGGLTLNVENRYVKRINAVIREDNKVLKVNTKDGLLKEGGEQLLTGKQAQAYARYRYGTSDGDFGRTVRQREVILKALDKVKALSMPELAGLAVSNLDKLSTDMSVADMLKLAPALFQLRELDVQELRIPIDKGYQSKMVSGMAVLVPDRSANRKAIQTFLLDDGN